MIREAMQFLTGLKEEAMEPKVVEIAGKIYCNKNLQRYDEEPMAKEITASTLTAMIDYIYNLSHLLMQETLQRRTSMILRQWLAVIIKISLALQSCILM